jgi:hypothetical protein
LFNKSSRLAAALGVEKIHTCDCFEFGHTFVVLPKLDKPHPEVCWNKSSCFAAALGVTNFIIIMGYKLKHFYCLSLTWTFDKPSSEAGLLNKSSRLAAALGVNKIITIIVINLFYTLCCTA